MLTQVNSGVFVGDSSSSRWGGREEDGEAAGEVEGGGIRAIAVSAEDNDWTLEGSPGEDPPQGLGELDQRHSPRHSCMLSTSRNRRNSSTGSEPSSVEAKSSASVIF
ncbi:hypothetical protein YC2023_013011 [Brassica napus]